MFVTKEFTFDAAHFLTKYYGKCERMHGHTYRLAVTVEGNVQENGMVIDFVLLKGVVKKHILEKLDHHLLNDIIENPSAENVVIWIWDQLHDLKKLLKEELQDPNLRRELKVYLDKESQSTLIVEGDSLPFDSALQLFEIKLWETDSSSVTYRGQ